jgi:transcriptional regulator with XRE-family HTH domain
MSEASVLVAGVKSRLRAQGIKYRELAARIGVSEPTIKRDLARGNFSLRRLDEICKVLGVSVAELAQPPESSPLTELTEVQEHALVANPRLLLVTYLVTNDWKFSEIVKVFELGPSDLVDVLLKLDKLRIIDFQPPTRIRKLASRNFAWRKDGPVQDYFLRRVVPEFFAGRFDEAGDEMRFVGGSLSAASMLRLQSAVQRLVGEFEHLAQQDARLPREKRRRCAAILGLRLWEFSGFTNLRSSAAPPRGRALKGVKSG